MRGGAPLLKSCVAGAGRGPHLRKLKRFSCSESTFGRQCTVICLLALTICLQLSRKEERHKGQAQEKRERQRLGRESGPPATFVHGVPIAFVLVGLRKALWRRMPLERLLNLLF